jgi:hypothetical protein
LSHIWKSKRTSSRFQNVGSSHCLACHSAVWILSNRTKIQDKNHRIEVLENNQIKQKFPDGGLVYALEPIGMLKDENIDKKLIRIGKSEHMQKRWSTYNTAVPDNFKLLYYVQTDNPIAVEYCIRSMLHKFTYINI